MPLVANKMQRYTRAARRAADAYRAARTAAGTAEARAAEARAVETAAAEARAHVQSVAAGVQARVHARIADVVTRALAAVFEEPYEFRLEFAEKRGRTEAAMTFARDGAVLDPLDATGGGVVDVAAFALRLAALMIVRPPRRRLLVLDEPFKFVSAEYRPAVRALLETLTEELGVQIIMVTHIPELVTGTVIKIGE